MISKVHERLEEKKTKMEAYIQERIAVAKIHLSEAEIRQILTSSTTAISIFKCIMARQINGDQYTGKNAL
jgi:hypothetical protein